MLERARIAAPSARLVRARAEDLPWRDGTFEALASGVVDASFTSQLTVLSGAEFTRGVERLRQADEAAGGELQLVADFRLYATIGWVS